MDVEEKLNQHERSIGRIEGKLESLATKEFVRKEVNEAVKSIDAKIDKKIDAQTQFMLDKFDSLSDKIEKERSWCMKVTGVASVLALVVVAISSLISTRASLGIIKP